MQLWKLRILGFEKVQSSRPFNIAKSASRLHYDRRRVAFEIGRSAPIVPEASIFWRLRGIEMLDPLTH